MWGDDRIKNDAIHGSKQPGPRWVDTWPDPEGEAVKNKISAAVKPKKDNEKKIKTKAEDKSSSPIKDKKEK